MHYQSLTASLLGASVLFSSAAVAGNNWLFTESPFSQNKVSDSNISKYNQSKHLQLRSKKDKQRHIKQVGFVELNPQLPTILQQGEFLTLNLSDETVNLRIKQVSNSTRQTTQLSHIIAGDENTQVELMKLNGLYSGTIRQNNQLFKIKPFEKNTYVIEEVNTRQFMDHNPGEEPLPAKSQTAELQYDSLAQQDSGDVIKVLVAYTPTFADDSGNADNYLALAEAETNTSYANSGVNTRIEIVHQYETAYDDSGSFSTDLSSFFNTGTSHGSEVADLRDQHNADIVVLMTGNSSGYGTGCGRASGIGVDADEAFAVAKEACGTGYYSFGHEIGHLIGARHIITQDSNTTPFAYGHGYCNTTANTWRTVMAYNCPSNTGGPRVQQWSNPDVTRDGDVTGTHDDENNARVINERAFTVANFRSDQAVKLINQKQGLCLDVQGYDGASRDNVMLYACDGYSDQLWSLPPTGQWGVIKNMAQGLCLDVQGYNGASRDNVMLYACDGFDDQQWQHLSDGRILNKKLGLCLDVQGYDGASRDNVMLYACDGFVDQNWSTQP